LRLRRINARFTRKPIENGTNIEMKTHPLYLNGEFVFTEKNIAANNSAVTDRK